MMLLNGANHSFNQYLICCVFILLSTACTNKPGSLKPFTTDGCSAFPDGTLEHQSLWAQCCIRHDLAYWQGGSYDERLNADQALKQCVAKAGEPEIADLMLAGVRVGGTPYLPTSFRWGYGWSWPRGYKPLTQDEKNQIKVNLKNLKLMLESLGQELETEVN